MKARLGDVCTVVSGSTPKSTVPEYWDGDIKWITPAELSNDTYIINDSARHITALGVAKTGLKSFPAGTVILSSRAPIGKTAIAGCEMFCNQGFKNLICSEKIDSKYLYYFLSGKTNYLNSLGRGATFKEISKAIVENIEIPLPEVEEQKRIAARFERLLRLIQLQKAELEELDKLVKSRFIELFGDPETNPKEWTRQRLDQICENLDSRRVPITSTDRKTGNYPYYGASGIVDYVEDYIFDEDILLISEDGANLVMRSTPIAFSVSGKVWVNNHAHVVRFESKATQKYIEICFALTDISGSITGTAQPKLNQAKLNAMMFCVPPIELQKQFAAFVEQTDKSKLAVQKGLQELEILKKSLMQQYFG